MINDDLLDAINKQKDDLQELYNQFQKSDFFINYKQISKEIAQIGNHANKQIREFVENFDKQFDISSLVRQVESYVNNIPDYEAIYLKGSENIKSAIIVMSEHGWFFDMELPFNATFEIKKYLLSEKKEEVNLALIAYFKEENKRIKTNVLKTFPKRKNILLRAFEAHENGLYELSIPVFFTQIDGICKECFKGELFLKIRNTDKTKASAHIEKLATKNNWLIAMLHAVIEETPISWSKNKRDNNNFKGVNRHTVLHGESLDYGTEENSLKVISLLNYVVQCHQRIDENNES